ncbi:unnamed protein product [Chironomus riparius]|uniref:Cuticle protein n=1 Tax=Chironomus riparius TaxID=315576 RepID=A0A9N9WPR3_9DIPT|nr:unnamed protein product [Chironomus riparius]
MAFKLFVVLSAIFAVSLATISGDYGSVGVQTDQTIRGALNTISSYSKAVNTAHSQSFVSRSDYTNNPGIIAHPLASVVAAPVAAVAHAPYPYAAGPYAAPYAAPLAYKAAGPVLYH